MKSRRICNARVVSPEGILECGGVDIGEGRIQHVHVRCDSGDVDLEECWLLPGLIDIHTHPPMNVAETPETLGALCDDLRGRGTAGFLFATGNIGVDEQVGFLSQLRSSLDAVGPERGCLGIHLEGPYVEFSQRGGFLPEAITNPREFPVERLLDACGSWAKYINIAPEIPGAIEAIRICRKRGLAVSIGHSVAARETLDNALAAGAGTICHTFNTGRIMRHREPGVLDVTVDLFGLAMDGVVCELICDGIHVDPLLVKLLYRAKGPDGVALVTDSLLGGCEAFEGQEIAATLTTYRVVNGAARNPEGGLCGSTLSMARAVRNFAQYAGCGLLDAARAASETPARVRLEGERATIRFARPHRAPAPGQSAVFYRGERLVGGGIIAPEPD